MKSNTLLFSLILSLAVCSLPSFAFGKLGHQLVCQLSYEQLTVDKQRSLTQLLSTMPQSDKNAIKRFNQLDKNEAITFAHACTWADAIKKQKAFKPYKKWHYINVDRTAKHVDGSSCKQKLYYPCNCFS